jgi:hypothetical protein
MNVQEMDTRSPLRANEVIAFADAVMCLPDERRQSLMQDLEREMRVEIGDQAFEAQQTAEQDGDWQEFLDDLRADIENEKGEPATDRDVELGLEGVRRLGKHITEAARGRHPCRRMIERYFIIGRALRIEEFASLSITDTAKLLGISTEAHHFQVKKMRKFMGCRLPGQKGIAASEAARKNALRQHGHKVEPEEHDLWRPSAYDSDKFKQAEKEISTLKPKSLPPESSPPSS